MIKIELPANNANALDIMGKALRELAATAGLTVPNSGKCGAALTGSVFSPEDLGVVAEEETTAVVKSADGIERDTKGVVFEGAMCCRAAKPYYGSGSKRAGQWKKRQGVTEEAYDAWYAKELSGVTSSEETTEVNTSAAFTPNADACAVAPKTVGELMTWISAKTAAEIFAQAQVDEAYGAAGIGIADMFAGEPATIAGHVATIYGILSQRFGA